MTQVEEYPTMTGTRRGQSTDFPIAVLISVPRVETPRVRRGKPVESLETWRRMSPRGHRPRRRLRRGVRLAAWSLLAVMPTLGGGALGWASLVNRGFDRPVWAALSSFNDEGGEPVSAAIDVHSVFLESNVPVMGAPVADVDLPVMIPGYLLPDDSLEEPAHVGS